MSATKTTGNSVHALPNQLKKSISGVSGSTPRALPVPLAPMAALALGGSLAYMGMTSLRRKS